MNRLEEDPLLGIPSYQQLIVYRDYERILTEEIEQNSFDSELHKLGYQDALEIVLSGIAQVISDPEFQNDTATIGISALQELQKIESSADINPDEHDHQYKSALRERVETIKAILENQTPVTEASQEFIAASAGGLAVSRSVDSVSESNAGHEKNINTIPIELTINEDYLKIGSHGKRIKLSSKQHEKQRDYAEYRARAIKFLVKNQDREVAPNEIWEAAFGTTKEFDKDEMQHIRSWLLKISYKNKPIVQINGKRGLGSRFLISNEFDVTIEDKRKKIRSLSKELAKNEVIPVEPSYWYVILRNFNKIKSAMAQYGFEPVTEELLSKFDQINSELEQNRDIDVDHRTQATKALQSLVEDTDRFDKTLNAYTEGSPEKLAALYVKSLIEQSGDKSLIARLVGAKILTANNPVHGTVFEITDSSGIVIWTVIPERLSKTSSDTEETIILRPRQTNGKSDVDTLSSTAKTHRFSPSVSVTASQGKDNSRHRNDSPCSNEKQSRVQIIEEFQAFAEEIAESFLKVLQPDKAYSGPKIQALLPSFNARVIDKAMQSKELRKSKRGQVEFNLEEVIRVLANSHGGQKTIYNEPSMKKDIDSAIERAIQKSIEKIKN